MSFLSNPRKRNAATQMGVPAAPPVITRALPPVFPIPSNEFPGSLRSHRSAEVEYNDIPETLLGPPPPPPGPTAGEAAAAAGGAEGAEGEGGEGGKKGMTPRERINRDCGAIDFLSTGARYPLLRPSLSRACIA